MPHYKLYKYLSHFSCYLVYLDMHINKILKRIHIHVIVSVRMVISINCQKCLMETPVVQYFVMVA